MRNQVGMGGVMNAAKLTTGSASLGLVLFTALSSPAMGQGATPADLQRENDELRQRIHQLESQLASTQSNARRLRTENTQLKKQLTDLGETPGKPTKSPGGDTDTTRSSHAVGLS